MSKLLVRIAPVFIFWTVFLFVILQVPYPENLTQANFTQLISFFTFLFLAFSLTINLFLRNVLSSGSISLGLIFLLILKALDSLNIVTSILIIIAIALLVSYFGKVKVRNNLTKLPKIPKLTQLRRKQ